MGYRDRWSERWVGVKWVTGWMDLGWIDKLGRQVDDMEEVR